MKRTSLVYGTIFLTFASIFSQILGFVYRVCLGRLIGAENMGLYQLVMPVYSVILSITVTGFTVSVSNLSSEFHALRNMRAVSQTIGRCLRTFFFLFSVAAVIVVLFCDPISVWILGDARTQTALILLLPCILLTGIENLHKHFFYGVGNLRPPAVVELLEQGVRTLSVLSLLKLFLPQNPERTVALIVLGMVVCEVFSACLLVLLYRRAMRREKQKTETELPVRVLDRKIFSIALPIGATALLGNLMASANAILIPQRLIAGGMGVSEAVSAFGVLFGMSLPLLFLPSAFIGALGLVLIPRLAESTALKRRDEICGRIRKAVFAISILTFPVLAFLIVLGPDIGVMLFREPTVGDHLAVLSVGVLFASYQSVFSAVLNGIGRQGISARNAIFASFLQLGFTYFTVSIPGISIYGFLIGFIVSGFVGALLNFISMRRATGLRPNFFEWLVSPGLSALFMGLCANLLFLWLRRRGLELLPSAFLCLTSGILLYLAVLRAQGIHILKIFRL